MASGVGVSDACKQVYNRVKMNLSKQTKLSYAVFKISDDLKEIVIDPERVCEECHDTKQQEQKGVEPAEFDRLVQNLPADDGRYVVYDYPYLGSFGPTSKIILIMWCPSGVPIKKKMLYASSKDALKKCFNDVAEVFQADCCEDLCHGDISSKLKKV